MLISGVAAHGFRHRHAGGGESHSHRAHAATGCEHPHGHTDHCHHSHASTEQAVDDEPGVSAGAALHVHVCIFGFDLSLPPSDESQHKDQTAESVMLLGKGNFPVPVVTRHLQALELMLLQLAAAALNRDVPSDTFDRIDHAQVLAPPLCEYARHERSGVLLI